MTTILIVGGADTGRAPMVAALLRRQIAAQQLAWAVGSVGVLGHDDDEPEIEARDAMHALGLDIADHRARSASDALVADAALLIAVDAGTARVLAMRFPEAAPRIHTLGDLAGRKRDIPDPFRMQVGVWMSYARELDGLLRDALPRMVALLAPPVDEQQSTPDDRSGTEIATADRQPPIDKRPKAETTDLISAVVHHQQPLSGIHAQRVQAVVRIEQLLQLAIDIPDVIHWEAARRHIETALTQAATPLNATDLALAYVSVVRATLVLMSNPPTQGQLEALHIAIGVLHGAVEQAQMNTLSSQLAYWSGK